MDICDALTKPHLTTEGNDLRPQVFNHFHQFKGADVGMGFNQNFGWGSGLNQLLHDFTAQVARVFDLAPQLAVRKCPGTAFAKLHIALRMQGVFAP